MSDDERAKRPIEPIVQQKSGLVSLHPAVYRGFVALGALFVLASWSFFGGGYAGLILAVVTLFFAFSFGVVGDLARIWRDHHNLSEDPGAPAGGFERWLYSDVPIHGSTVSGRHAAFMAALPVMAVAVAMVVFAIAHVATVG